MRLDEDIATRRQARFSKCQLEDMLSRRCIKSTHHTSSDEFLRRIKLQPLIIPSLTAILPKFGQFLLTGTIRFLEIVLQELLEAEVKYLFIHWSVHYQTLQR